jgi:hypothetical protein
MKKYKILHTLPQLRQERALLKETAKIVSGSVNLNDTATSTSNPWNRVLEKLIAAQLVKKFLELHGT